MKPSIVLRLIVSLVVIGAFVLGATVAEASNSLNPTALWWAQRQLPLLWTVDGFALLALLPVFGSAILQTRLAQKSEELTHLRAQHETQVEDTMQHAEELERRITQQAKSIAALEEKSQNMDVLEATVEALTARLAAMETDNRAHQENMEAEMRRMAVDAFSTLAGEVQANTRQMEAVSLAMQYQRAEIKQLRQNLRATQRPQEINEVARLTPHELSALQAEAPPLLLEEKEKRRKGEEEAEGTRLNTE